MVGIGITNETNITTGMMAMGVSFNPSDPSRVDSIKKKCADLYDELHELRNVTDSGEKKRMLSVAMTELQTAQMWAVKAVTRSHE